MSARKSFPLKRAIFTSEQFYQDSRPSLRSPRYSHNLTQQPYKNPIADKVNKKKALNKRQIEVPKDENICQNCKLRLNIIKDKVKDEIQQLKAYCVQLKERINQQIASLTSFLKKEKEDTKDRIKEIMVQCANEMEEKNFRLEIETFYQQEQIKQLKTLLQKQKNKLNPSKDILIEDQQPSQSNLQNFLHRQKMVMENWAKTKKRPSNLEEKDSNSCQKVNTRQKKQNIQHNIDIVQRINKLQSYIQKGITLAKGHEMQFGI